MRRNRRLAVDEGDKQLPVKALPMKVLPVEWYFSQWSPVITNKNAVSENNTAVIMNNNQEALVNTALLNIAEGATPGDRQSWGGVGEIKPLIPAGFIRHPARHKNPFKFKSMKKNHLRARRNGAAFTLIELLVVIAIIAILASMTLAAIAGAQKAAKKVKAKTEMADLVNAITQYESDYSRFPVTTNEQAYVQANNLPDFTTGLIFGPGVGGSFPYSYDNNSNVVAILMDMQVYQNGNQTVNFNHVKNPKQNKYLNAKMSGYTPLTAAPALNVAPPGVDNTGVYRDPWGNPYVITMDLNYDNKCNDQLYSLQAVSQNGANSTAGYNGLSNTNALGAGNFFQYNGQVMVWSAGPDGKYDPGAAANNSFNKDNVISWQN